MSDFAKVFQHPEIGQVLLLRQNGDTGPEVRVMIDADGINISAAIGFKDSEEGEALQRKAFDKADESFAFRIAEELKSEFLNGDGHE